jgi:acyl carrier protein
MTLAADIKPRLKEILVDRLKLDRAAESIGDAEPLFGPEGLGLDSIDALELVIGVEQEFGVRIENEEVGTKLWLRSRSWPRSSTASAPASPAPERRAGAPASWLSPSLGRSASRRPGASAALRQRLLEPRIPTARRRPLGRGDGASGRSPAQATG